MTKKGTTGEYRLFFYFLLSWSFFFLMYFVFFFLLLAFNMHLSLFRVCCSNLASLCLHALHTSLSELLIM